MSVPDDRILNAIDQHWQTHWTSPNVRQLCQLVGWRSPSTAAKRLEQLVRAGRLERKRVDAYRVLYRRSGNLTDSAGAPAGGLQHSLARARRPSLPTEGTGNITGAEVRSEGSK